MEGRNKKLKFYILILALILFFGLVALVLSLFVIMILKEFVWTSLPNVEPLFEIVGEIFVVICLGFVVLLIVVIIAKKGKVGEVSSDL